MSLSFQAQEEGWQGPPALPAVGQALSGWVRPALPLTQRGRAGRTGNGQPGEERALGDPRVAFQHLKGAHKNMERDLVQEHG